MVVDGECFFCAYFICTPNKSYARELYLSSITNLCLFMDVSAQADLISTFSVHHPTKDLRAKAKAGSHCQISNLNAEKFRPSSDLNPKQHVV